MMNFNKYAPTLKLQTFFLIQLTWLSVFSLILMFGFFKLYSVTSQLPLEKGELERRFVDFWRSGEFATKAHDVLQEIFIQTDRLWLVDPQDPNSYLSAKQIIFDLSSSKEFSFLLNRMRQSEKFQEAVASGEVSKFVVDLGAFNGLTISNSFNWLQLGWDGMMVEPTPRTFENLKRNTKQFQRNPKQKFIAVQGAITEEDGPVLFSDRQNNHAQNLITQHGNIEVEGYSPKTLFSKHSIPKKFGVLSVDIEGNSKNIVELVLASGYTPYYIIMEEFDPNSKIEIEGYKLLFSNELNNIYELDTK